MIEINGVPIYKLFERQAYCQRRLDVLNTEINILLKHPELNKLLDEKQSELNQLKSENDTLTTALDNSYNEHYVNRDPYDLIDYESRDDINYFYFGTYHRNPDDAFSSAVKYGGLKNPRDYEYSHSEYSNDYIFHRTDIFVLKNSNSNNVEQEKIIYPQYDILNVGTTDSFIENYTIVPLSPRVGDTVAVASVHYGELCINHITLHNKGDGNMYIQFPRKLTNQGTRIEVVHPISPEDKCHLSVLLVNGFRNNQIYRSFLNKSNPSAEIENFNKYPENRNGILARMDIAYGTILLRNVKLTLTNDGVYELKFPSYRTKAGNVSEICIPSGMLLAELTARAISEYKVQKSFLPKETVFGEQRYRYLSVDDNMLKVLKKASIPLQARKIEGNENIIKFKTTDLPKVNNIIERYPDKLSTLKLNGGENKKHELYRQKNQ